VPLLIIPPWINKFYILDLREKNSFMRWAVEQGHTVFVVSWVNPDAKLADKGFEDYLTEGSLCALDAMRRPARSRANVIGYCLGGTLLACTLATWRRSGDTRIRSATFFVTMMDFERPGELGVFIDEEQLSALEGRWKRGYLEGSRDGDDLQHAARERPDLVLRRQQLPDGQGPVSLRPALLERDSTRMPAGCTASTCATCT
jgi:polyhydroxyalkanoate synthase subunit PhaC